jgi:hypothetical protein
VPPKPSAANAAAFELDIVELILHVGEAFDRVALS